MSGAVAAATGGAEYQEDDAGHKWCSNIGQHLYTELSDEQRQVMAAVRKVCSLLCALPGHGNSLPDPTPFAGWDVDGVVMGH